MLRPVRVLPLLLLALPLSGCQRAVAAAPDAGPPPDCEWCGATEAPARPGWDVRIAPEGEPGEPLVVEGTVRHADGRTPASDAVLYLYHTDARGLYPQRPGLTGNGRRHGALRAWLRPDAQGRYRLRTIRPASYPDSTVSQHIHVTVKEAARAEYWLPEFHFDDDPHLTARERAEDPSAVVKLTRGPDGVWRGRRDIVLPR